MHNTKNEKPQLLMTINCDTALNEVEAEMRNASTSSKKQFRLYPDINVDLSYYYVKKGEILWTTRKKFPNNNFTARSCINNITCNCGVHAPEDLAVRNWKGLLACLSIEILGVALEDIPVDFDIPRNSIAPVCAVGGIVEVLNTGTSNINSGDYLYWKVFDEDHYKNNCHQRGVMEVTSDFKETQIGKYFANYCPNDATTKYFLKMLMSFSIIGQAQRFAKPKTLCLTTLMPTVKITSEFIKTVFTKIDANLLL